ncbi:MAG: hypothetical protein K2G69_08345 [Muribaculaceae bacterium]|nr:hypothetical protein [Muribaculaceae bacterium]
MYIGEVDNIIKRLAEGFEEACLRCLQDNSSQLPMLIREQLWSGVDGNGEYLSPNYDNDPFFSQRYWYHTMDDVLYEGSSGYKAWKLKITPPERGDILGLPARPENIPNLFIDGTFHASIKSRTVTGGVEIFTDSRSGGDIVGKYGSQIFNLTEEAVVWFNESFMRPAIAAFFNNCGYR